MKKKETDSPTEESARKNILEKIKSLLKLRSAPDTAKELECEIHELLEEGEEQGLITVHEERMFSSIFDFRDTVATEIMTPSAEIIKADCSSSVEELIALIIEEGHTRLPIYKSNPDDIIGILHSKNLLPYCVRGQEKEHNLIDSLYPPVFIKESTPIAELLRYFQQKKTHLAMVVDEFGSIRGLITLEDVVEEIVGEIDDEHDQNDQELQIIKEDIILVDAKIDIEEVEQFFNITVKEGPYESVGGLILHQLGRVPAEDVVVEVDGLRFTVQTADQRRIKTLRVERCPSGEEDVSEHKQKKQKK
jgi:CBS domain containing-hemolysin-like protein